MKIEVRRSHFIGICNRADSVEEARAYLALLRQRYAEASHRVYAFAIGHGATVTHGMSDDGEPSGTAGRPVLAVLQGAGIGDAVVAVIRYFGGTKLGTGGLVRAYTQAAQEVLAVTPTQSRVETETRVLQLPYDRYKPCRAVIDRAGLSLESEFFTEIVTLTLCAGVDELDEVCVQLQEITAGRMMIVEKGSKGG